jgi:two-component system phosphate regulon sensor histidine kinase PhoR
VQLINPAVRSFFEINEERLLGKSLIETFRHHQLVEIWQRCFETGQSQVVVLDFVARKLYLQCVATPLGNTQPQNILLLLTDLTRLRHLETIRQDFIHNISHELRTPLASLKALTETLLEGAMEDPPAARKFLQSMETEVDALSLMVSELLELSRIESGRVPLKLQPSSPCELLTKVVERLSLQAERAGLTLATHCDPGITPILADPSRMEQVLVNLLHNAIKFTPEGGRIDLFASQEGEAVLFSIQDTGAGIPASDLNRIFERFYKTDRARRSGGTGLGLAISRHLVEAHGGKIWAESVEGQGSTFFFTVPTTQ